MIRKFVRLSRLLMGACALLLFLLAESASAVTIDWVSVGGAGNTADTTGYGAVAQGYRISKTEVTNGQYTEFLNAKAAADPEALYNTSMGSGFGGITRSGSSGSFTYSAIAGRTDMPVNFVSFYDSLRFSNWLNNGQGSGGIGSRRCVSENSDNTQYVKLLTIVDKLFRCGGGAQVSGRGGMGL